MAGLPSELFTVESLTTLVGLVGITYVLTNAIYSATGFKRNWLGLLVALLFTELGVFLTESADFVTYLIGIANGCLVYLASMGSAEATDKIQTSHKIELQNVSKRRRFFSSWWIG